MRLTDNPGDEWRVDDKCSASETSDCDSRRSLDSKVEDERDARSYVMPRSISRSLAVLDDVNRVLTRWARKRYKRFHRSVFKARQWLREISERDPNLFYI